MLNFLLALKNLYNTLLSTIDKLCQPNPKHTRDKAQYELAHLRNKAIMFINLALILLFYMDIFLIRASMEINIARCFCCITLCSVLALSCRYHPEIFNVFVSFLCITIGPFVIRTSDQALQKAWPSTLVIPMFAYFFTGSTWHFIFQTVVQIIYNNTMYIKLLERSVEFMAPENFSKALTHSVNMAISETTMLVIFSQYLMQKAYTRIARIEKKKKEFESQKTFLLGFSHELRNLINSLTGNVQLASFEKLSDRAKEFLLNAEVCGELLLHMINNILDTGKVQIGELEINPVSTRTYDAFERMWGICSELIRRKNLKGSMKIEKNLPKTLMMDHYRLTQIFLNLIGNAVKFTERGSIDIKVSWIGYKNTVDDKCFQPYPFNESDEQDEGLFEKERSFSSLDDNLQTLSLTSRRIKPGSLTDTSTVHDSDSGILKVVVSDTGCGMTKSETERLFQKFTQVTSDASKKKLGTGLGLFITRQLCQRMGGEIKVFSKKEKGSAFIFCIPAEVTPEENEHLHDMELTHRHLISKKLKVMIVDDAPFSHTVLKCFFAKLGIEVVEIAVNGAEAYQKYMKLVERNNAPDIVTMDLDMPIMDGKEAAQKIRQIETEKNIKPCFLSVISGNCTESEISECMKKNGQIKADAFLKKPASMEELLRVLAHHFS